MPTLADQYFEWQTQQQKWDRPDFESGVSSKETIDYLKWIWDIKRLEDAQKVLDLAGDYPVKFVLVPLSTAAYVAPWSWDTIYYNLFSLWRGLNHKHIVRHESIHLRHQKKWGSTKLPWFDEIPAYGQSCFAKALWTELDERMLLEWLTEREATLETNYDPNCAYNLNEVPLGECFDELIKNRAMLAGLDLSIFEAFSEMGNAGSKNHFQHAMIFCSNQLILEDAAEHLWVKVDDALATKMALITRDLLQSGRIIETQSEAIQILKTFPVDVLWVKQGTLHRMEMIGVPRDKPSLVQRVSHQTGKNVFWWDVEEIWNGFWREVQSDTAEAVVGILWQQWNEPEELVVLPS